MTGINTEKNLTGKNNSLQVDYEEDKDNSNSNVDYNYNIIEKETDLIENIDSGNETILYKNSENIENTDILNVILASDIIAEENDINFENVISDNDEIETLYSITEEMTDEIISLSDRLNEQFKQKEANKEVNEITSKINRKISKDAKFKYHIGSASAALSLIFMGFALIYGLFSVNGIIQVFRLSPVMLVFLGIEILLNAILKKSFRFRVNLFDYALSGSLILITFLLSLCYVGFSNSELTKENIENRLEGEMNEVLTKEFLQLNSLLTLEEESVLIGNVESEISLYNEDLYGYKNIQNIQASDSLNIKVYFNVAHKSISKFAADCVKVLAVLKDTNYPLDDIEFTSREQSSYIYVKLNARLQSDIKVSEIMRIVDYYIDNINMDDLFYEDESSG